MQSSLCNIRPVFLFLTVALPSSSTFTRISIPSNRLQSQNKSPGLNLLFDFREQLWLLALAGPVPAVPARAALKHSPAAPPALALHADADQDTL